MLDIVCFKWKPKHRYRSHFGPDSVNVLKRMLQRHYKCPHRLTCVTDDPSGIDSDVRIVPLWSDFADIPSPHGLHQPSCYRRLKLFSPEAKDLIGPRFVSIDLDTVITGDLAPVFNRQEDFVAWGETDKRSFYNGSLLLMTAGARPQVWDRFDPKRSPEDAMRAGRFGSDQGWLSHCLGKGEAMWGCKDGVYSYRIHILPNRNALPPDARMVMFHGRQDPWSPESARVPWIREHYR
jgi:hypothetical protein